MGYIQDLSLVLDLPLRNLDGTSFMSEDTYGHLCTVTGALWSPRGRSFDGDDYINLGSSSPIANLSSAFTIEMWINSLDTSKGIFKRAATWNTTSPTQIEIYADSIIIDRGTNLYIATFTQPSADVWHHLVFSWDGTAWSLIQDGSAVTVTTTTGTPHSPGTGSSTFLGQGYSNLRQLRGIIAEARMYSRALNPLEIIQNYLTTKWRYK